ncbi:DUF397 domain-containing protein [Streptomyces millisiae]|uniref:DUF397 domain-containing protein n=1 Tax=Streptomyces millisiae TaxID=3075542 RepID=A0ABU2LRJ1_9ACTN|nr:DUF397 domain-containing protein [Streptomyces sp. DSM 44918]MDT0320216.1 DUF397 domain-containing protein [Streptomyces sp. DSM 44918]
MSTADDAPQWRRSSYSNQNGGDCVEVGWRKSSYSNGDGADCLEVGDGVPGALPVRDSKVPVGQVVTFIAPAWASFVRYLRES